MRLIWSTTLFVILCPGAAGAQQSPDGKGQIAPPQQIRRWIEQLEAEEAQLREHILNARLRLDAIRVIWKG